MTYECEICNVNFPKKDRLQNHIERVHEQLRRYKCVICEATFKKGRTAYFIHLWYLFSTPHFFWLLMVKNSLFSVGNPSIGSFLAKKLAKTAILEPLIQFQW